MTHPEFIIDFLAVGLLLFGFINEDKLIDLEQNIKRIIVGNYRRYKRIKKGAKNNGSNRVSY